MRVRGLFDTYSEDPWMNLMDDSLTCILFSTADWDSPYWTNKQHMARSLASRGIRVLFIESLGLRKPTINQKDIQRMIRRLKKGFSGHREVEKNVFVLSPLAIPFKHHLMIVRMINQGLLRLQIKNFMKKQDFQKPVIWTYHPFMLETISGLKTGPVVYHCVDDLSKVPGINAEKYDAEEEKLLTRSEFVFTTSEYLVQKVKFTSKAYFFPNVVDLVHFERARKSGPIPEELLIIPEPRLVYVGALSDYKIDFQLIYESAIKKNKWQWVFIGEEREGQINSLVSKMRTLPNCHFLGYKAYKDLPEYLRGMQVGLLPSLLNEYTKSMFPMKYYEYLAAGLPVVSTPLEFTKGIDKGILVGKDVDSFCRAIEEQIKRGRLTDEEAKNFVGENTWEKRLTKMLEIIRENL